MNKLMDLSNVEELRRMLSDSLSDEGMRRILNNLSDEELRKILSDRTDNLMAFGNCDQFILYHLRLWRWIEEKRCKAAPLTDEQQSGRLE